MARTAKAIDAELESAVGRRATATRQISRLSAAVVAETGLIDRLLAERNEATAALPTGS